MEAVVSVRRIARRHTLELCGRLQRVRGVARGVVPQACVVEQGRRRDVRVRRVLCITKPRRQHCLHFAEHICSGWCGLHCFREILPKTGGKGGKKRPQKTQSIV